MLPHDPDGALQVEAGDVIVVPQGETHLLGSSIGLDTGVLGSGVSESSGGDAG